MSSLTIHTMKVLVMLVMLNHCLTQPTHGSTEQSCGSFSERMLKEEHIVLRNQLENVNHRLRSLEEKFAQANQEKLDMRNSAFFAHGIRDGYGDSSYKRSDKFIYLKPDLNDGGHYNSSTGQYTCPLTGLYYFSFTVFGHGLKEGGNVSKGGATLVKENIRQGEISAFNSNADSISLSLSQSVVVKCNKGEKVWVESRINHNNIEGTGSTLTHFNVFTGMALSVD